MNSSQDADLIPIESESRTIQKCFKECLYDIPDFQRPYSWEDDQLNDFWNDVVQAAGDFFFGSTVTWVSQKRELFNDTYSVIDGQQRLTTCAIALSVVRDAFEKISEDLPADNETAQKASAQAKTTQKYLIAEDDDGKEYRVINRVEKMFFEQIQKPNSIPSKIQWDSSSRRIGRAREFFETKTNHKISACTPETAIERLKVIRANILKAKVIQVEMASEADSFLVFETLNTRGEDLRLADLTKNLLVRGAASDQADRKTIADRWSRLSEKVMGEQDNRKQLDRFLWQSWNSRREAVKEPELFKAITAFLGSSAEAHLSYLEELEYDAEIHRRLQDEHIQVEKSSKNAGGKKGAFEIPEFVDSVRALAIFNISVANSAIFAAVRKYETSNVMQKAQLLSVMNAIEVFHFRFSALNNSGSTGGTRGRYNRFAVQLENANSKAAVSETIAEFKDKLKASLPLLTTSIEQFEELFYAPKVKLRNAQKPKSRKMFICYVLQKFSQFSKHTPAGTSPDTWSIEHIKPQSNAKTDFMPGKAYKDPVFSIGNLILLTEGLNSELSSQSFDIKKSALKKGAPMFDSELDSWSDSPGAIPTDAEIQRRAKALARTAINDVWII
ncbi:DUF262 domain-containing HNH endonuclease family protein [Corynebacterium amycolatum]|uniref:DUF262 domain-containing HNH endonuclease family protein n=1 Tax=Corynebacterium amycolatum TaxID=43765 RepID=A0AAW9SWV7_CORAY|nr:DUF262 domain-containing HNH endonuclease family protein [Corynebacterium amycolatum]MDK7237726.1 DUF262 domain-containing HNH endonuclease family protein [Corynebacterium amycolatum]MDK7247690.1 DUF262 domain-containing HNH endonuclease family protein [Corynebacterium amycolatum]